MGRAYRRSRATYWNPSRAAHAPCQPHAACARGRRVALTCLNVTTRTVPRSETTLDETVPAAAPLSRQGNGVGPRNYPTASPASVYTNCTITARTRIRTRPALQRLPADRPRRARRTARTSVIGGERPPAFASSSTLPAQFKTPRPAGCAGRSEPAVRAPEHAHGSAEAIRIEWWTLNQN